MPSNLLETLADRLLRIVLTNLVLALRVPKSVGAGGLAGDLAALWPRVATYVISFVVLGIYWFAHHQVFHFVARVDRTLVWLNILFFMGVTLTPFAASLLGAYPNEVVAIAFSWILPGPLSLLGYVI